MFTDWLTSKRKLTLTIILLATFCFSANQAVAQEYIVKLKQDLNNFDLDELKIASEELFTITDKVANFNLVKVSAEIFETSEDPVAILKRYFDAEYVVENIMLHAFVSGGDPRRSEQWALDMINANEAWTVAMGSHNVVVAVIDTGIALSHEDLSQNIWTNQDEIAGNGLDDDKNGFIDDVHGWDFNGNDADPKDETGSRNPGHGTHCSGIVGAVCNNDLGVCGISPQVSLMALRFLDQNGSGDLFASVKAIDYAISNGAHIISASWGANIPESSAQPIVDAIKRAEEKGLIFVAAAANDGKSNDVESIYPANAQTFHMISVAASNSKDEKPPWSNFGRKVDIAAPGENILSTVPDGYKPLSGTSMATPLVAGTVALMKSVDLSLDGATARSILQSTGAKVNIETASNRRIDAAKAVEAVRKKQLTVVPAAYTLAPDAAFKFSAWGGAAPYAWKSLNPDIASIDEDGTLKALKEGEVSIEVTDASGNKASSVSIKIGHKPQGGSNCPLPDPMLCSIMCIINPSMPWCNGAQMPEMPEMPEWPQWPEIPMPF